MDKAACDRPLKLKKKATMVKLSAFADELTKIAAELSKERRAELPKKDFAQPNKTEEGQKGKYPIPDRKHAKIALGLSAMHHDTGAQAAVKRKVRAKYPDMVA